MPKIFLLTFLVMRDEECGVLGSACLDTTMPPAVRKRKDMTALEILTLSSPDASLPLLLPGAGGSVSR